MTAPDSPNASRDIMNGHIRRGESPSQASQQSQTASDFIDSQLKLEADAREALPYAFDHCTQPLGPLRQNLFSCLTCNPPPQSPSDPYTPAAVCYSCSIACHGEHTLVELFNRRNFTCDCGTTRLPPTSPCTLRIDPATGLKGPVQSQPAAEGNTYNHNCRNRFCSCGEVYNAEEEKGTMFQCLGLVGEADGGCGEDWWHPECVVGLGREWFREKEKAKAKANHEVSEDAHNVTNGGDTTEDGHPLPPHFPNEDRFDAFICYKCVEAAPWIKRYAGTAGFLPPVYNSGSEQRPHASLQEEDAQSRLDDFKAAQARASQPAPKSPEQAQPTLNGTSSTHPEPSITTTTTTSTSHKRSASTASLSPPSSPSTSATKKHKPSPPLYHNYLPIPPTGSFSLFCKEDFRDRFCRCADCYPLLKPYPQLLEEEESYEPPISEGEGEGQAGGSAGTGSLLDRGEAALSNVDRVRAIEGVMVYNHLKDKVKTFLQPFAESGQAVGAEDIKAYFEKLRGDEQGIQDAAASGGGGGEGGEGDSRREQSGY